MKILNLNACVSLPDHPARERLDKVAEFCKQEKVDVIFLQEGLRICYPVYSRTRRLARALGFEWCARRYIGVPWFWEWELSIISRYRIIESKALYLEVPQKVWLDALPLPGRRRAVAAFVDLEGVGITAIVNVHLTSSPRTEAWRQEQVMDLLNWMGELPADAVVLAGDFNFGRGNQACQLIFDRGFKEVAGYAPDFVFSRRGNGTAELVLTKGITDHAGGVLVDLHL